MGGVRCTIEKKLALTVGKMGALSGLLCSGTPLATQAGEGQGRSGAGREASAVNGQEASLMRTGTCTGRL